MDAHTHFSQATPNAKLKVDLGEDSSTYEGFRVWRNSDANLEYGPIRNATVQDFAAKGWKQTRDAEGKTVYLQPSTGRITYYNTELV